MVLEFIISGLVAFVKDKCAVNDAQKMHIVLVNGEMEPHKAKLKIPFDSLAEDRVSAPPDDKETLPGNKSLWVWYLDNEQIKLHKPPDIRIYEGHRSKNGDDYVETKPNKDEPDDFSWAPEIHRACGIPIEQANPRPEVKDEGKLTYKDNRDKDVQFAVARFAELKIEKTDSKPGRRKNQLSAVIDELSEMKEPKVFKFAKSNYKQAVADKARLSMKLNPSASGSIEIKLVDLMKLKERTIYLKKKNASVVVENEPTEKQTASSPAKLAHFHEYLKLLKDSASINCPVPEEEEALEEPGESGKRGVVTSGYPVKCTICVECGP